MTTPDRNATHTAAFLEKRRRRYQRRKVEGRCPRCGFDTGGDTCQQCRERQAERQRERRRMG